MSLQVVLSEEYTATNYLLDLSIVEHFVGQLVIILAKKKYSEVDLESGSQSKFTKLIRLFVVREHRHLCLTCVHSLNGLFCCFCALFTQRTPRRQDCFVIWIDIWSAITTPFDHTFESTQLIYLESLKIQDFRRILKGIAHEYFSIILAQIIIYFLFNLINQSLKG